MLLDNHTKQSPIVGVAGLGGGINSYIFLSSGGDYIISKSLRFNSGDSAYLNRTPSSASNQTTFTIATWIKRTTFGSYNPIFSADTSATTELAFTTGNELQFVDGSSVKRKTNAVFRDPSAWYHIVLVWDTTNSTVADRCKIYVNGTEQSYGTAATISENETTDINTTDIHYINRQSNTYGNSYLADLHFVDGQALTPTSFGETDSDGVWQPKKFSGSHGTNGFHLDFKDNSSNAALGYDAAGSNNYTVNNLVANDGAAPSKTLTRVRFKTDWNWMYVSQIKINGSALTTGTLDNPGDNTWSNINGWKNGSTGSGNETYSQSARGDWFDVTLASSIANFSELQIFIYLDSSSGTTTNIFEIELFYSDGTSFTKAYAANSDAPNQANAGFNSRQWQNFANLGLDPSTVDSLPDSPSQNIEDQTDSGLGGELISNYATYNSIRDGSGTKSNGNLTVTGTGQVPDVASIAPNSGKWYAEIKWDSGSYARVGLQDVNIATSDFGGVVGQSYRYESNSGNVQPGGQTYSTYAAGDIIGVAFDCDAGKLWLAKNGTWQNSGNPAGGTGAVATNLIPGKHYAPANSSGSGSSVFTLNAGQRAFSYTAPTGFKALCSDNLTATIASPSTYFDTFLYTGDGTPSRNLTLPLAADFLWVKKRSGTNSHQLVDTVRGDNSVLHTNSSNRAKNPQTQFTGGGISSLSGTTATLSQGTSNNDNVNADTSTLVGWAWEAGNSDKTYTITVADPGSGNKFYADGALQPTLTLAEGSTYKFDQSNNSNATHPLRFSTSSDGTHGGGSEYTTGVTTVGTPGSAGAYTQIVIPSGAPVLYAYCVNHSGMGFQVNTSDVAGYTIPAGAFNDTDYDRSKSWISLVTTSSLSSDYNSYSATSKLGALDGKRSTSLYGVGGQSLTITFDASAFPSSDGPYTVEVENNQRAVTLNGSQTGSSWPLQATGWQKFDPVSTITTIASANAGSTYGGMINRIRVNGKILADPTATPDNIPSISTQVLASPESGFSISKWAGNAAEATAAHGLNSTPLLYFVKSLDNDEDWEVQTTLIGTNALDKAVLNTTAAFGVSYHQVPTNHFIGRPSGDANGENMIAYCFAPVEGYSAVGKYFSGSANNFIYVGFRPKFLLVKKTATANDAYEGWIIFDSERDSYNISNESLFANNNQQKGLRGNGSSSIPTDFGVDFLSNGFCFKDNSTEYNRADVGTYIYYAVAEHPFNSSRAR